MSVAAEPRSHAPYAEPDEYIDYQLRKTQTGIKRIDMLTAAVVAITVLIGYVLLFVLSDHWLFEGGVGGTARVLMFLPVIGFVGWLIGAKVIWPALKTVSGLYAARTLEASSTEFRSGLLNLVDLKQAGREVSPLILATMEKRAAVTLAKFNVDDAIDKRPLLRTLYVLFGIVVAFCLYSVLSPKKLGPSVLRAIAPFTNVTPATQTEIVEVKPGDAKLRAGGILPVSVQLRGEIPADVTLLFTTADRRFVDEPVQLGATTDPNLFEGTLGNDEHGLLQSFSYHVVAGDARSSEYRVEIITPPSATVTEVRYDYPEYTELDPRTQMGGAVDIWERTAVTINAATNIPVKRAEFEFADTEDFSGSYPGNPVKIADGKKLTINWRADARQSDGKFPKFYRVKVWDDEGNPDPKPAIYPINVRIDQPPQVVLIDPTTNLEVPANATIPLVVAARDQDFKLRTISLKIDRGENDITDEELFNGSQQEIALKHDFALEPLRLKAGDKLRIWVEAQDNKLPTHNLAKTPPIEITITDKVTKEEAKKQLEEEKKEQQKRIDEAAKKNEDRGEQQPGDAGNSPEPEPRDNNREPPKDQENDANPDPQQKGQPQDDKMAKGQEGAAGKTQKGGEGKKTESGTSGKSDKPQAGDKNDAADGKPNKPSVKNDGSQDQEALDEIINSEKRRGRLTKKSEQKNQSPAEQRDPKEKSAGEPSDDPMPNGSQNRKPEKDSSKPNDDKKPGASNRGQTPKSDGNDNPDPNGAKPNDKPGEQPNPEDKGADPKAGNNSKKTNGPKEGNDSKPGDDSSEKPEGTGQKPGEKDPKSSDKSKGGQGQDKNADGGKEPMPKKTPSEKNDPAADDKANGEKSEDNQKSPNDKSGNDQSKNAQKQSDPNGSGKPDSQKPKGAGKPETDDKQRSPDGAKTNKPSENGKPSDNKKPSEDGKPADPKGNDPSNDKPGAKKPNDPSGKGSEDKNSKSPNKQPGADKSDDGKPSDKPSDKGDSSKKPKHGKQGEKSSEPSNDKGDGDQSQSDMPGGDKPGQPKEDSQKSDQGGKKPGGQAGNQKPSGKEGNGESSDSKSDSNGSAKSGSQGSKPGKPGSAPGGGQPVQGGNPNSSSGSSGSGSSSSAPEEANEEFTKEAANLVLKRLQKDIERGELDQELLDELGWTPEQMKKFVDRMQQQLEDKPDDNSPQAKARQRQFEEMLKNLNLTEKTQRRDDSNKEKQTGDGIGPVRRPPPPEYREAYESFTKGLSKKKSAETPKKK